MGSLQWVAPPDAIVPSQRRRLRPPPSVGRPLIDGAPGLAVFSTSHGRHRTSIPGGAGDPWSKCLIHALASVVAHRDERCWVDLLTMNLLHLSGGPSRGGRHHPPPPRQAVTVSRRCQDWFGRFSRASSGGRLANPSLIASKIRAPTSVCPLTFPTASLPSSRTAPSGEHAQH